MTPPAAGRQLPLPFDHAPFYPPEEFFRAPSNEEALAWLARPSEWPNGRIVIWGDPGSGKTHLLHVWAAEGWAALAGGVLLPGRGLDWTTAATGAGPIAVDDADAASEPDLLHFINIAAERGRKLVLTGRAAPDHWPAKLPDLRSRLRATAAVELHAAAEELLSPLFARLLAERQLAVPAHVQAWLLRRLPRSPAALSEAAGLLDRALLASGGRMTRGLAASIVERI